MSRNRTIIWISAAPALLLALTAAAVMAGQYAVPFTFTDGDVASAAQVNQNFQDAALAIDDNDARIQALEAALNRGRLIRAAAHVEGDPTPQVTRWFNRLQTGLNPGITVSRTSLGVYVVDFGSPVADLFIQATLGDEDGLNTPTLAAGGITVEPTNGDADSVTVRTTDPAGFYIDNSFYIEVK